MTKIRCPYCLKSMEPKSKILKDKHGDPYPTYVCSKCNKKISREYLEEREAQKISIGMVGFRGHGKTTYLSVLFYLLDSFLNNWKGSTYRTLNKRAFDWVYDNMKQLKNGNLPQATPTNFPEPVIVKFFDIPILGSYITSLYDTGGEVFENPDTITDAGKFVAYSDVVLFIVSIADIQNNGWVDELNRLLNVYIMAVKDRIGIETKKKQHLIVVFTKADLLQGSISGISLSNELINYLNNRNYNAYVSFTVDAIKEYSKEIKNWLERSGATGFTNLSKRYFKSVEYTIVSSIGANPVGDKLGFKLSPEIPKRVLDPFLLALDKMRKRSWIKRLFG